MRSFKAMVVAASLWAGSAHATMDARSQAQVDEFLKLVHENWTATTLEAMLSSSSEAEAKAKLGALTTYEERGYPEGWDDFMGPGYAECAKACDTAYKWQQKAKDPTAAAREERCQAACKDMGKSDNFYEAIKGVFMGHKMEAGSTITEKVEISVPAFKAAASSSRTGGPASSGGGKSGGHDGNGQGGRNDRAGRNGGGGKVGGPNGHGGGNGPQNNHKF